MKERIINDVERKNITPTDACLALLTLEPDQGSRQISDMLRIPYGTVSAIRSRFKNGKYKHKHYEIDKYIKTVETKEYTKPQEQEAHEDENYEEMYFSSIDSYEETSSSQYTQAIGRLREFGLFQKLMPLAIKEPMVVKVLEVILNFVERNSNVSFKLPKIFTYSLKAVVHRDEMKDTKNLHHYIQREREIFSEISKLQDESDNMDQQVLEMFKNGNPARMSELYTRHKEVISKLSTKREEHRRIQKKISHQTELLESILKAKLPS